MALPNKKKSAWADQRTELLYAMDWGDYMTAKKAKLEEQFQEVAKSEFSEPSSNIFSGVAIFVNGYTDPTSSELKRLMMEHGGVYHHYLRPQRTTHMIASNLPYTKIVAYRKAQNPLPLCKPEWITDSIREGKLLDFRQYLLYQNTKNQPSVFQMTNLEKTANDRVQIKSDKMSNFDPGPSTSTINVNDASKVHLEPKPNVSSSVVSNSTKNPEFLTDFYNNSRLHHIATMGAMFKDYINDLRDKSDGKFPGFDALKEYSSKLKDQHKIITENENDYSDAEEEIFASEQNMQPLKGTKNKIIMHIDMDCFFVSVGLRNNPGLRGHPIAVAHAKGNKQSNSNEYGSMSEVSSCSYEARKAGVKNGMFLGQALKLCPNLKTIKYDFEGYKEVSSVLYDTVASYTLDIEAVSCDELYVDCTNILHESNITPMVFASKIRNEINEKTGCPVSTGFGENKLQARLATKKAKPNGQFWLHGNEAKSFIKTLSVKDLPGVGYSTNDKLRQLNIKTCSDLEAISLSELQKEFGKKNGQQLYDMCRGIDNSKLNLEHVRKSISAEVNYGIRFEDKNAAHDFLKKLSDEISDRLKKVNSKGKCITLKVMFRAKEAPDEPRKFMGHGVCNAYNKSKNLIAPTDDPVLIAREAVSLWDQFNEKPEDARGIGIQITKLESRNKPKESTLLKFFDKMKEKGPYVSKCSSNENLQSSKCTSESDIIEKQNLREGDILIEKDTHEDNQYSSSEIEFSSHSSSNNTNVEKDCSEIPKITASEESSAKLSVKLKQTTQPEYFKQKKPFSSTRIGKVKLPDIHEIDMKVLIELPEDIRNEILNQYKEDNGSQDKSSENPKIQKPLVQCINQLNLEKELSFSQVDPEFLAALPDNIKNDVKTYCDEKKRAKSKEIDKHKDAAQRNWNMLNGEKNVQRNVKSRIAHFKSKSKTSNKKEMKNSNLIKANEENSKNKCNKIQRLDHCQESRVPDVLNRTLHFDLSEGNAEHSEILSNLVNCLLDLPISQVKVQIKQWILNNTEVNSVDFLSLTTYLGTLPRKKRLSDLFTLMKCLHRCIAESNLCIWHKTYLKTFNHVQTRMHLAYGNALMIPEYVDCVKCQNIKLC